ncbi:TLC domain-containing protein At5g14285-like [Durio zibethinus]|uniref:TLC domain-containing protein At5g14285-like n=1 Tax=Durio zibethinus TaxID=66656 RepID=A0A6P5Y4E9_DURZI|nr:TLC domain-containing protein At5g14285-like [Durio zibethinus]
METLPLHRPNLPTFFLLFLSIYIFAYLLIFRNWGPKHRSEATSCFMSLAHGTPAVFMAVNALINTPSPRTFASPNSALDNIVLEYSISYFLMDLFHYLVFYPNDILFILHHLATLYVFFTCRYMVHHGAFALLVLLVLAEVTSPCQNVWSLAGIRRADVPAAAKLYELLSPLFYAFYSVVRGILGPFFVYKMGFFYLSGVADNLIPRWAWASWLVVIITAILLSIVWVFDHWTHWYKRRNYKAVKKSV